MRRSKLLGILAAAVFALAGKSVLAADTLTILWAEWDPANYLQELVKDYEKQTGVKVVVETVPWPDFQTKAANLVRNLSEDRARLIQAVLTVP